MGTGVLGVSSRFASVSPFFLPKNHWGNHQKFLKVLWAQCRYQTPLPSSWRDYLIVDPNEQMPLPAFPEIRHQESILPSGDLPGHQSKSPGFQFQPKYRLHSSNLELNISEPPCPCLKAAIPRMDLALDRH